MRGRPGEEGEARVRRFICVWLNKWGLKGGRVVPVCILVPVGFLPSLTFSAHNIPTAEPEHDARSYGNSQGESTRS